MPSLRTVVLVVACGVATGVAVGACSPPSDTEPPATVGSVPVESDQGTLLPVEVNTMPPDSTSLPPDALFGGDLCTALGAADVTTVTFAGRGTGRLVDSGAAAEDACQYDVEAGGEQFTVLVRARSRADFEQPASSGEQAEPIDGIGEAAVGVARGDGYEVIVQVPNGWFSVLAPDATSARFLAGVAAVRSTSGA